MSPTEPSRRHKRRPQRIDKSPVKKTKRSPAAIALPWIARIALLAATILLPWMYGGVLASTLWYANAAVMVALAAWIVANVVEPRLRLPYPTAMLAVLGGLVLGVVQFMPNPRTLDQLRIPEAPLADAPATIAGRPFYIDWIEPRPADRFAMRTLNPAGTRQDLALLVLAASVFFLSTQLFHGHHSFRWACIAIGASGAALGFLSIAQMLASPRRILWLSNTASVGSPFGPFVNRNCGGGYMNLCLAAALGALYWTWTRPRKSNAHHRKHHHIRSAASIAVLEFAADAPAEPAGHAPPARKSGGIGALQLWALVVAILPMAAVVASLSRGAVLALAAGSVACLLLLITAFRRLAPAIGIVAVAALSLAFVAAFGVTGKFEKRLTGALEPGGKREGRIAHWNDALKTLPASWFLGNGLGAYRYIYRPFQDRAGAEWYFHAENQYLEALVDGGAVGLGLLLLTLGLVVASLILVIRRGAKTNLAFALVATMALATQVLQAGVDFGLYVPANALLFALLCGAIVGKAVAMPLRKGWAGWLGFSLPRLFPAAVLTGLVLLAGLSWAQTETSRLAGTQDGVREVILQSLSEKTPKLEVDRAIARLETAILERGNDAEAHQALGELYLHGYRLRKFEQLAANSSAEARKDVWQLTDPAYLHKYAVTFALAGDDAAVERLRGELPIAQWLRQAYDHFDAASQACPLIGAVHLRKAELCFLVAHPFVDRIHLQRALRVASAQHAIQYRAGLLHWSAERFDAAMSCWRRSLELSNDYEDLIFDFALQNKSPAEISAVMLPDSPPILFRFARKLKDLKRPAAEYGPIFARAEKVLETDRTVAGPERLYLEAQVLVENGKDDEAIDAYQRAIVAMPEKAAWIYELAVLLFKQGRYIEAHEYAKRCLPYYPNDKSVRELLIQINRKISLPTN